MDQHEIVPLAFELLVLETCLGDISALCTQLSKELESSANAALDALTRAVRTSLLQSLSGATAWCRVYHTAHPDGPALLSCLPPLHTFTITPATSAGHNTSLQHTVQQIIGFAR